MHIQQNTGGGGGHPRHPTRSRCASSADAECFPVQILNSRYKVCRRWNDADSRCLSALQRCCNVAATLLVSMLSHVGMVLGLSSPVGLRSGVWLAAFLRPAVWPFRWMVCDSGDAARGRWLELAVHAGRWVRFPCRPRSHPVCGCGFFVPVAQLVELFRSWSFVWFSATFIVWMPVRFRSGTLGEWVFPRVYCFLVCDCLVRFACSLCFGRVAR